MVCLLVVALVLCWIFCVGIVIVRMCGDIILWGYGYLLKWFIAANHI
jgi:hypothetical protein